MFERFGDDADRAEARARVMYFLQVGYRALELSEPLAERIKRVRQDHCICRPVS